ASLYSSLNNVRHAELSEASPGVRRSFALFRMMVVFFRSLASHVGLRKVSATMCYEHGGHALPTLD
ncbi:MAG TPA: hypothetical protein VHD33_02360, partial [Legionellaceae bacterium]|nr:hypothetical protein [Legionellaceae bacterium]